MKYQVEITNIEIMDGDDVAIEIEAIDRCAAKVTMRVATNVDDWAELSSAVNNALLMMHLSRVPA